MSWTLCTSGAAIAKAGAYPNDTIVGSGATLAEWSNEVEGTIVSITRQNWVGDYTNVNTYIQYALADLASDLIAMKIINYDMSGYTNLAEAQLMLNVLRDNADRNIKILQDLSKGGVVNDIE